MVTPILIHNLGAHTYGAWVLIGSMIGYASLFDFGVGLAAMKMIAELSADKDKKKISELLSNAIITYAGMGLVIFAIGMSLLPFFSDIFNVPQNLRHDTNLAYLIVVIATGLTFMSAAFSAALQGLHDFKIYNFVVMLQTILAAGGSIVTVKLGGGLIDLSIVYGVSCVLGLLIKAYWVIIRHKIAVAPHHISKPTFKRMLSFSSSVFVINVGSRIIFDTDAILIGHFLGTQSVAAYQVALGPGTALRKVGDQLNSITLTTSSKLHSEKDTAALQKLLLEATRFTLVLMVPIILVIIVVGKDFIRLWVGEAFVHSYASLVILAIGLTIVNIQSTSSQVILALNKHARLAKVIMMEATANLVLSIVLLHRYGITGVALGTAIPTCFTALCYSLPAASRLIGLKLRLIGKIVMELLLVIAITVPLLVLVAHHIHFTNLVQILLLGAVYYAVYLTVLLGVSKDFRAYGTRAFSKLAGKGSVA